MKTIYKYPLQNEIEMPIGGQILCVKTQYEEPFIWAIVNTGLPTEKRLFKVFGTGQTIKDTELSYIGTYFLSGGTFVYHVFETTLEVKL